MEFCAKNDKNDEKCPWYVLENEKIQVGLMLSYSCVLDGLPLHFGMNRDICVDAKTIVLSF